MEIKRIKKSDIFSTAAQFLYGIAPNFPYRQSIYLFLLAYRGSSALMFKNKENRNGFHHLFNLTRLLIDSLKVDNEE